MKRVHQLTLSTHRGLIQDVSANYASDIMLVMLGFNDLGWFYSDANGLVNSMGNLIANARRSNPNQVFVIGTVPQRTFINGRADLVTSTDAYNRVIRDRASEWSTPNSPVRFHLNICVSRIDKTRR